VPDGHQHQHLRAQHRVTAFNLDYRVVVLSDCVASMYGEDLHVLGLQNVARCLGWVLDNAEFRDKLELGAKRND
jgi:nicotinamidase-related amidase